MEEEKPRFVCIEESRFKQLTEQQKCEHGHPIRLGDRVNVAYFPLECKTDPMLLAAQMSMFEQVCLHPAKDYKEELWTTMHKALLEVKLVKTKVIIVVVTESVLRNPSKALMQMLDAFNDDGEEGDEGENEGDDSDDDCPEEPCEDDLFPDDHADEGDEGENEGDEHEEDLTISITNESRDLRLY